MTQIKLDILYDDGQILIINKPEGLLTHRSPLSTEKDSVVDRLKLMFDVHPSPVHRLDRPTSGVIISAFSKENARALSDSFINGEVQKNYIAVVRGFLKDSGFIDIPLKKDGEGEFQEALTHYKTINQMEIPVENNKYATSRYSLVLVKPETGRFHQIRRHLARIGHPIIGDTSHGDLRHNRIFEKYFSCSRLLLHAESITFPHPVSGDIMSINAPILHTMNIIVKEFS